ncbi:MAG: DUF4105 domain-containing protein [Tannerellaceae bacterium]|jgi:hypothetical protein|nr:DUF4105 domain-containing protein [Tannerellaceae bacterium]
MNKVLFPAVFFMFCILLRAQTALGDGAQVSLLTCSPSEEAVFTVYGHTAIRVCDAANGTDVVFNYGIFNFSGGSFVYRFARGRTDYRLEAVRFERFLAEYGMRGSGVTEQRLDLTPAERGRLWDALLINLRPENAVYRYNFFFDNCATRPAEIIRKAVDGEIVYGKEPERETFRRRINRCMRNQPWLVFGCDLALGSPTDRVMTFGETFFLPLMLEAALDSAVVVSADGVGRRLVASKAILLEEAPVAVRKTVVTPLGVALLMLLSLVAVTVAERRRRTYYAAVDGLLFALAGLAGCVLFFLAVASEHPAVWPNWSLAWLHPLHLVGAALTVAKGCGRAAYYYHFINFAALTLMLAGAYFIPEHFNVAFFPLIVCLWMRSGLRARTLY